MKITITAIIIASLGITACQVIPGTDANKVAKAEKAVSARMKDPTSTIFTDVSVVGDGVCGMVNGKNSFGAYEGSTRFVWEDDGSVLIEGESHANPGIEAMNQCRLEKLHAGCKAGKDITVSSIYDTRMCSEVGQEAIRNAYRIR